MTNKHLVALCVFFQYLYKDSSHGLCYSHIRTLLCSFDVEEITENKNHMVVLTMNADLHLSPY